MLSVFMNTEFSVILSGFVFYVLLSYVMSFHVVGFLFKALNGYMLFMFHLQQGKKHLSVNAVRGKFTVFQIPWKMFVQYIVGVLQ